MDDIQITDPRWPGVGVRIKSGHQIYDSEGRNPVEPLGYYEFAWRPRRCRNGRVRWLCWVERHSDGTFTLGNRAS